MTLPHTCPANRRCFDCQPRVPSLLAGDTWMDRAALPLATSPILSELEQLVARVAHLTERAIETLPPSPARALHAEVIQSTGAAAARAVAELATQVLLAHGEPPAPRRALCPTCERTPCDPHCPGPARALSPEGP